MFWVLQKNLFNETAFEELLRQLDTQDTKYEVVNIIPFAHEMEPDINPDGPIFAVGATAMSKIVAKKGWKPGYFGDNINYTRLLDAYSGWMLNDESQIRPLREITKVWDEFFIRPDGDAKQFSGQTMFWEEFEKWRESVINLEGESSMTTLTGDDLVVMAPLKEIYAEYRFYVVDEKVITGSMYKQANRVYYVNLTEHSEPELWAFAQQMVDLWSPNRAFALDIAMTENGYEVIEINAINSAGFYACDMGKFVNAINEMEFN